MADDFESRVIANPDADGKAIALYTNAPSEVLAQAEIQLLKERALREYPGRKIVAYMDVDPNLSRDQFISAYKGKDRQRFFRILRDLEGKA